MFTVTAGPTRNTELYHYLGTEILMMTNSMGGGPDSSRLANTISYAAGMAAVKRHTDTAVFLASLNAVLDHEGILFILWNNRAAAMAFGALMADAWEFVGECCIYHFVIENGQIAFSHSGRSYSGKDPSTASPFSFTRTGQIVITDRY